MSSRDALLDQAREHCFFSGVGDGGAALCEAIAPFGVAKIHHVQRALGHPSDATFISAPDASVTRNRRRWQQGFSYGGAYAWTGDFAVLDIKPNCCGMVAGTLSRRPDVDAVRARFEALKKSPPTLDGVVVDWDFDVGNHFVDLFDVVDGELEAPYAFIIHTAGRELRAENELGLGLYYDHSDALRSLARQIETPWGSLTILEESDAASWYAFYLQAQDFARRRRELIARYLLGDDATPISNHTHQGLVRGFNQANLGCYTYERGDDELFPFTMSESLPAYLVRGAPNLSAAAMRTLGWEERAERLGVTGRIQKTNLLPHGGGYTYPDLDDVGVVEVNGARRFELRWKDDRHATIDDPRDLPYVFRGDVVRERMRELELGQTVATLKPFYVLDGRSIA